MLQWQAEYLLLICGSKSAITFLVTYPAVIHVLHSFHLFTAVWSAQSFTTSERSYTSNGSPQIDGNINIASNHASETAWGQYAFS